jgi:hypothetical protein
MKSLSVWKGFLYDDRLSSDVFGRGKAAGISPEFGHVYRIYVSAHGVFGALFGGVLSPA